MLGASNAGEAEIQLLARQTMSAPWVANHPLKPGHDELAAALRRVERAGREPAANGS
jgi:hypothetical protein